MLWAEVSRQQPVCVRQGCGQEADVSCKCHGAAGSWLGLYLRGALEGAGAAGDVHQELTGSADGRVKRQQATLPSVLRVEEQRESV